MDKLILFIFKISISKQCFPLKNDLVPYRLKKLYEFLVFIYLLFIDISISFDLLLSINNN